MVTPEGGFDRTPPHDDDAERSVLGAVLLSRKALEAVDYLKAADFYKPAHETIFGTVLRLAAKGDPVDAVTVVSDLISRGELGRVGGGEYVHGLIELVPATSNADYYGRKVRDYATKRRLIEAGTRIAQLGYAADGVEVAAAIEHARAEVDAADTGTTAHVSWVADTIDESIDALEGDPTYHPTPWAGLNDLLHGWRPGAFYVLAARPGVGKSIAGLDATIGLCSRGPVALSSLEMPTREMHFRLIANQAGVPIGRLDKRELTEADWAKIARHRAQFGTLPISIDDRGEATVADVVAHARAVNRSGPIGGVVVDYLQLMSAPAGDRRNRNEVVGDFSRRLKILAKELDCPVIALAQLNRKSADRADRRPEMTDLRESGSIEQDADVVILLHENQSDETDLDVILEKNRHGPKGQFKVVRRGWYSRMDDQGWSPTRDLA